MRNQNGEKKSADFLPFYGLMVLLLTLVAGCLDVIDIETPPNNQESLVIQGKLVVGAPAFVEVKLSKLFNFTADGKKPVNAQSVILFDEDNHEVELEDVGLGNYQLSIPADHPTFKVDLGKSYGIKVRTFDGRNFESALEKANPVPKVEELNYRLIQRETINQSGSLSLQEYLQYSINTPLRTSETGNEVRLGWEYQQTFKVNDTPFQKGIEQKACYISQNLNVTDLKVVDATALTKDFLKDYQLYETSITRLYSEGLYFTVIQESLSETAYDYFTQINENTGRTGNMFEAPPGKVISNITNINDENDEAFGFFYVTQQDTIRKYVNPELIGSPPAYCPPPGGLVKENGACADPICCDCLSVPNSTVLKPAYWIE